MTEFQHHFSTRVLIVEDQIAIALEIEAHLKGAGLETVGPAVDVRDAAALVAVGEFDVAVLDVGLVEQALHDVMWPLVTRRTPIVFFTAFEVSEMPAWALPAEYVTKPCDLKDLLEKVHAVTKQIGTRWKTMPGETRMRNKQDGLSKADYVLDTEEQIRRLGRGGLGLHEPLDDALERGVMRALPTKDASSERDARREAADARWAA